jgi:hypothetical protein
MSTMNKMKSQFCFTPIHLLKDPFVMYHHLHKNKIGILYNQFGEKE